VHPGAPHRDALPGGPRLLLPGTPGVLQGQGVGFGTVGLGEPPRGTPLQTISRPGEVAGRGEVGELAGTGPGVAWREGCGARGRLPGGCLGRGGLQCACARPRVIIVGVNC